MEAINLSRELDSMAEDSGYEYCPDDILKTILSYTGDMNRYPTGFYQIKVKYNYYYENERKKMKRISRSSWIKYCSCCECIYQGIESHIRTDKHKNNYILNGDKNKCNKMEILTHLFLLHKCQAKEIQIDSIEYHEYFTYDNIFE